MKIFILEYHGYHISGTLVLVGNNLLDLQEYARPNTPIIMDTELLNEYKNTDKYDRYNFPTGLYCVANFSVDGPTKNYMVSDTYNFTP